MDWTLIALVAMVGGGLFLAIRSVTAQSGAPDALDRLEQMAAAASHNPLMPSLAAVGVSTGPRSRVGWWRQWMDARAEAARKYAAVDRHVDHIADVLDQADLRLRPYEWYAILIGSALVLSLILTWRFMWVFGLLGLVLVPTLGGQMYLRHRIGKRLRTIDGQLSDILLQMSNGLKAGYSFFQALNSVVAQAKPPLGKDLARIKAEAELGVPLDEALRHFADRIPTEDIDLFVTAVAVTRVLGGNLAQILELIAATVRERVRIQGEIRTLTAQARTSGLIVTLLPFFLAGSLTFIAPDYFTRMWHDPIGIAMLITCAMFMAIGWFVIRKIVTIDV